MPRRWPVLSLALLVLAASLAHVSAAAAWTRGPERIAGADRYGTAVEVSKVLYPTSAGAAVIASGESFPDALVGGPLAARVGGPVLLARRDSLPGATASELTRLRPSTVYVIGGSSVVSDAVVAQIASASAGIVPQRVFGNDRYETAAAVARLFTSTGGAAFVASGQAFPDALAGGAAAAAAGVPLLLTRPEALPSVVASELARLRPPTGAVLGGSGAVSDAAFAEVGRLVPSLRRLAGADRYYTAAAIAADQAPVGTAAVLATGLNFPDALASAPLAARLRAPLLLSSTTCAPPATLQRLSDAGWPEVTAVGGSGVLSRPATLAAPCVPPDGGELVPGLRLDTLSLPGPQVMRVLTLDRTQGLDLVASTAVGGYSGRMPTSEIARRTGAIAAVNGDFFTGDGIPVHALASEGRLLKSPGLMETMLAFDSRVTDGALIGRPAPTVSARIESSLTTFNVNRVNGVSPAADETVLYTTESAQTVVPPVSMCALRLFPTDRAMTAPAGETTQRFSLDTVVCGVSPVSVRDADVLMVPSQHPSAGPLALLPKGEVVTVTWRLQPQWGGVMNAVGANLTLVRNGARTAEVVREGAFYTERAPRTAVGVLADGRLVIVTVDGRQKGYALGMTVRELADQLVTMGVVTAANLDGGGSTAMAIRGVLANHPSDAAGERSIGPALLVIPRGTFLPPPPTTTTTAPSTTTTFPTTTSTTVAGQAQARASSTPVTYIGTDPNSDPMKDNASLGGWLASKH